MAKNMAKTATKNMATNMATAWQQLDEHYKRLQKIPLADLYDSNPQRAQDYSENCGELTFDYSRNLLDDAARACLFKLVETIDLPEKINAMMHGAIVNYSEQQAALHTALRSKSKIPILSPIGQDERQLFTKARQDCKNLTRAFNDGDMRNAQGSPLTHIVHVGIGGSEIGTRLLFDALKMQPRKIKKEATLSFISDLGGAQRQETLAQLDPSRCLFLLVSKSFRTEEMLHNAKEIYRWLQKKLGTVAGLERHFIAITAAPNLVQKADIGVKIPTERILLIPESVGGRYSVWSAVSLSVQMLLGTNVFEQFLNGAECADTHFREKPPQHNIPVIMALLGVWYRNICKHSSHALIPYDHRLRRLPCFLQQLEMESGGKSRSASGEPLPRKSAPLLWGAQGTNAQHSLFQWIQQTTESFAIDFFIAARGFDKKSQRKLSAHCLAQMETLMRGKNSEARQGVHEGAHKETIAEKRIAPHSRLEGNRASNLFIYRSLSPYNLGMILAFYEHKVFVQSLLWKINPFDQWGVEAGKKLAENILPMLEGEINPTTPSLRHSIELWQALADFGIRGRRGDK